MDGGVIPPQLEAAMHAPAEPAPEPAVHPVEQPLDWKPLPPELASLVAQANQQIATAIEWYFKGKGLDTNKLAVDLSIGAYAER